MSLYKFISENKEVIDKGYHSGIVNSGVMNQFKWVTSYLKLRKTLPKMVCYQWVADENNVSDKTIREAVKKMGVE